MKIEYCPTKDMIADFLTKPLQGELFRIFRAVIMGHVHLREALLRTDTCKEQRVNKNNKDFENIKNITEKIRNEIPENHQFHETYKKNSTFVNKKNSTFVNKTKMTSKE